MTRKKRRRQKTKTTMKKRMMRRRRRITMQILKMRMTTRMGKKLMQKKIPGTPQHCYLSSFSSSFSSSNCHFLCLPLPPQCTALPPPRSDHALYFSVYSQPHSCSRCVLLHSVYLRWMNVHLCAAWLISFSKWLWLCEVRFVVVRVEYWTKRTKKTTKKAGTKMKRPMEFRPYRPFQFPYHATKAKT